MVHNAIRGGQPIADKKREALHRFAAAVVKSRGWPSDADIAAFLRALGRVDAEAMDSPTVQQCKRSSSAFR